jgi:hypothetical protein
MIIIYKEMKSEQGKTDSKLVRLILNNRAPAVWRGKSEIPTGALSRR